MRKTTNYILEERDEIELVKDCLNYCFHRATQHNTPMTGQEVKINKLRKEFRIIS